MVPAFFFILIVLFTIFYFMSLSQQADGPKKIRVSNYPGYCQSI